MDAEYGILVNELTILVKTKNVQNNLRVLSMKSKKRKDWKQSFNKRIKHSKMVHLENLVSDFFYKQIPIQMLFY